MGSETNMQQVYGVTCKMISQLEGLRNTGQGKALLAGFRRSAGKSLTQAMEIWPFIFENCSEELLGQAGKITYEEKSLYYALQLYAICVQGSSNAIVKFDKSNMGDALRVLRTGDSAAADRRFNAMITSDTIEELVHHLRQLLKISVAKGNLAVDFASLANDLFWFQRADSRKICFEWANNYYRINKKDNEKTGGEDNE